MPMPWDASSVHPAGVANGLLAGPALNCSLTEKMPRSPTAEELPVVQVTDAAAAAPEEEAGVPSSACVVPAGGGESAAPPRVSPLGYPKAELLLAPGVRGPASAPSAARPCARGWLLKFDKMICPSTRAPLWDPRAPRAPPPPPGPDAGVRPLPEGPPPLAPGPPPVTAAPPPPPVLGLP